MNLPELTHEEEVKLERFANLMVELIEKHADAVDKDEMMAKLNKINGTASGKVGSHAKQGEGNKNLASFLCQKLRFYREKTIFYASWYKVLSKSFYPQNLVSA